MPTSLIVLMCTLWLTLMPGIAPDQVSQDLCSMSNLRLPFPSPDPTTQQFHPFALQRNLEFLSAKIVQISQANDRMHGMSAIRTGASTGQFSAKTVVFRDLDGGQFIGVSNFGDPTVDLTLSGPIVGGRDESGNFANEFVHLYFIYNGVSVGMIASTTAPPTGPAMPADYFYWAYAATIRVGGTNNQWIDSSWWVRGSTVFIPQANAVVLSAGGATTETAVDYSTVVPINALDYELHLKIMDITTSAGGAYAYTISVRNETGLNRFQATGAMQGLTGATLASLTGPVVRMPAVNDQEFFYLWNVTTGSSPQLTAVILSYRLPNGDV